MSVEERSDTFYNQPAGHVPKTGYGLITEKLKAPSKLLTYWGPSYRWTATGEPACRNRLCVSGTYIVPSKISNTPAATTSNMLQLLIGFPLERRDS